MRYLSGEEEIEALRFINRATEIALNSSCYRSRCGTVIVKDGEVISSGFNSPPQDVTLEYCIKDSLSSDFKSDKTCCVHAEQRAIMEALKTSSDKIIGSRLYFIRLDERGEKEKAGDPYCTICSKMALDSGVKEFVLFKEEGICVYDTDEYNSLSFGLE